MCLYIPLHIYVFQHVRNMYNANVVFPNKNAVSFDMRNSFCIKSLIYKSLPFLPRRCIRLCLYIRLTSYKYTSVYTLVNKRKRNERRIFLFSPYFRLTNRLGNLHCGREMLDISFKKYQFIEKISIPLIKCVLRLSAIWQVNEWSLFL